MSVEGITKEVRGLMDEIYKLSDGRSFPKNNLGQLEALNKRIQAFIAAEGCPSNIQEDLSTISHQLSKVIKQLDTQREGQGEKYVEFSETLERAIQIARLDASKFKKKE